MLPALSAREKLQEDAAAFPSVIYKVTNPLPHVCLTPANPELCTAGWQQPTALLQEQFPLERCTIVRNVDADL